MIRCIDPLPSGHTQLHRGFCWMDQHLPNVLRVTVLEAYIERAQRAMQAEMSAPRRREFQVHPLRCSGLLRSRAPTTPSCTNAGRILVCEHLAAQLSRCQMTRGTNKRIASREPTFSAVRFDRWSPRRSALCSWAASTTVGSTCGGLGPKGLSFFERGSLIATPHRPSPVVHFGR